MERRKRVYPNRAERMGWFRGALIALTVLIVLGGLAERTDSGGFLLERQVDETKPKLEESFDETMTEAEVELQENHWYALQVGAFENEAAAKEAATAFQKRGAAGYLWQDGRYRVLAAVYPAREDAQLVRQQLREQHEIDSYLYEIHFPALKLRMQGMQGQLDIFQAALMHAHDLAVQVQQLSVQMDRQEVSSAEVMETLNALQEQMEIVVLRIEQRFSKPRIATVQALSSCFESFIQFVSSLPANESVISMGMRLKYQAFEILSDIRKIYDTLDHT